MGVKVWAQELKPDWLREKEFAEFSLKSFGIYVHDHDDDDRVQLAGRLRRNRKGEGEIMGLRRVCRSVAEVLA